VKDDGEVERIIRYFKGTDEVSALIDKVKGMVAPSAKRWMAKIESLAEIALY
jgi:hypothetical protein